MWVKVKVWSVLCNSLCKENNKNLKNHKTIKSNKKILKTKEKKKQAGAELGQAQVKLGVIAEDAIEVVVDLSNDCMNIHKGFLDFSCGGGWVLKMKLMLTQLSTKL